MPFYDAPPQLTNYLIYLSPVFFWSAFSRGLFYTILSYLQYTDERNFIEKEPQWPT